VGSNQPATTPQERAELVRLHGLGMARNAIAAEMGRSAGWVSNIARQEGLSFDRESLAIATKAKVADNRARRAAIVQRLYDQAEAILDRLENASEYHTLTRGSFGVDQTTVLDFIPAREASDLQRAAGGHLLVAAKLEAVDAGAEMEQARSMVALIGQAIAEAATKIETGDRDGSASQ
jgi:hypothetical protein